jgi:hypothetical protein
VRNDRWSEAIAVGTLAFVESVKSELGGRTDLVRASSKRCGRRLQC